MQTSLANYSIKSQESRRKWALWWWRGSSSLEWRCVQCWRWRHCSWWRRHPLQRLWLAARWRWALVFRQSLPLLHPQGTVARSWGNKSHAYVGTLKTQPWGSMLTLLVLEEWLDLVGSPSQLVRHLQHVRFHNLHRILYMFTHKLGFQIERIPKHFTMEPNMLLVRYYSSMWVKNK